ncbi:MAG TPA: HEAT repeat domain-containing protein [Gemmatimonadales bacterium]|nr:HEAT repeat domain-containing protein [Gemmatimonadales bacterium]
MLYRSLGVLVATAALAVTGLAAQTATPAKNEPVSSGRPLSAWIADLKAPAPQSRNAAAYEIAGLGPAGAPAVPALIAALDDELAVVRFPVTVALGEIGPAAEAAVPRLLQVMEEDINDEVAAGAKRAIKHIKPEALSQQ